MPTDNKFPKFEKYVGKRNSPATRELFQELDTNVNDIAESVMDLNSQGQRVKTGMTKGDPVQLNLEDDFVGVKIDLIFVTFDAGKKQSDVDASHKLKIDASVDQEAPAATTDGDKVDDSKLVEVLSAAIKHISKAEDPDAAAAESADSATS